MMTALRYAIALVLLLLTPRALGGVVGVDPRVDDRMVVHVEQPEDLAVFIDAYTANNAAVLSMTVLEQIPGRPVYLLGLELDPGCAGACLDLLEADLESNYAGILRYGDFLYLDEAPEGKSGSVWVDTVLPPDFGAQYAAAKIRLPEAHQMASGLGTVVAVLDTGIDPTHPALANRVLTGFDFVDGDGNAGDTANGADDDGDGAIDELHGHGTYVAGLVALTAPGARLLPVRVLNDDGVGDLWILTKGLYYAIDRGVEVINLSLGSTYDSRAVKQAMAEAIAKGIVLVASAGNFNRSDPRERPAMDDLGPSDPIDPPLDVTGALGVAATDPGDVKADFSNYSHRLSLSAPGDLAAGPPDPASAIVSALPGGVYATWEGTSFATAFVSGAAALVRSQHPEWPPELSTYLAVEAALVDTAADIYDVNPAQAPDQELGAGRLDAGAAVALGGTAPPLGDLNGDGLVAFGDILLLIGDWGLVHSSADLNGDGSVGLADLLVLIGNWS